MYWVIISLFIANETETQRERFSDLPENRVNWIAKMLEDKAKCHQSLVRVVCVVDFAT